MVKDTAVIAAAECILREAMHYPAGDPELVQIVDAALADAARRAGHWLVCKPGCTPCCHGPFTISALDAARLEAGLLRLTREDPARAARVRERVGREVARIAPIFPGDVLTGELAGDKEFAAFAEREDGPCPVLCPGSGTCDLYTSRPMTCRVFGPPVESEDGIGHCELCFIGASEADVIAAEMDQAYAAREEELIDEAERSPGAVRRTIVTFALAGR